MQSSDSWCPRARVWAWPVGTAVQAGSWPVTCSSRWVLGLLCRGVIGLCRDSWLPPGLSHDQRSRHPCVAGVRVRKPLGGMAPRTMAGAAHPARRPALRPLLPQCRRSLRPRSAHLPGRLCLLLLASVFLVCWAFLHPLCVSPSPGPGISPVYSRKSSKPSWPKLPPCLHAPPGWRVGSPGLSTHMLYNGF